MHQALAKERSHQMGLESLGPGAKRLILATLQDILKIRNDPLLYSQIVAVCLGKKSSLLERFVCKPVWEMSLFRYLFLGWGMGWANSNCVLLWLFVGSAHTFLLASRPRHGVGITFEEFQVKQSVKTQALKFLYLESEKKSHDQNSQIPKNPWIYPLEIFHTLPTGGATDCQLVLPKHQWPCRIGTNWWWWALGSFGATRHINIATNQTHLGMGIYVTRGPGWLPRQSAARSFLSNQPLAFKALWMFGASSWAETRTFTGRLGRCWVLCLPKHPFHGRVFCGMIQITLNFWYPLYPYFWRFAFYFLQLSKVTGNSEAIVMWHLKVEPPFRFVRFRSVFMGTACFSIWTLRLAIAKWPNGLI